MVIDEMKNIKFCSFIIVVIVQYISIFRNPLCKLFKTLNQFSFRIGNKCKK